jgi:hypothetical protein
MSEASILAFYIAGTNTSSLVNEVGSQKAWTPATTSRPLRPFYVECAELQLPENLTLLFRMEDGKPKMHFEYLSFDLVSRVTGFVRRYASNFIFLT